MAVRRNEAGASWAALAQLDPLAAVLDPGDVEGAKNRVIDHAHKHALARAAGRVHGRRALDFGCGTGRLTAWLVDHGAITDGVDATPEMLAVATARVPRARFHESDGSALPFPDCTFDLAVTAYVLQYYLDDESIVRELARVLSRRGRLIAIEQVADEGLPRGGSLEAYRRMFNAAGLAVERTRVVRWSDSRVMGAVSRRPQLARAPGVARLLELEAFRTRHRPATAGRYRDVCFTLGRV